jgi:hypothetical protein
VAKVLLDEETSAIFGDRDSLLVTGAARIHKLEGRVFVESRIDVSNSVVGGQVGTLRLSQVREAENERYRGDLLENLYQRSSPL